MTLTEVLFNHSEDKSILYHSYSARDVWSLAEAPFIANGKVPIPENMTIEEAFEHYPTEAALRKKAIDACLGGKLKFEKLGDSFYLQPKKFLDWIVKEGWELPDELLEVMREKKWLKPPTKIKENTRSHHKQQVLELGKRIAERLGYFNQQHIYDDEEMQNLLKGFVDDYGMSRTYSEVRVKEWLSALDPRPKSERRGRPLGSKKE